MIEIKRVVDYQIAKECDDLLTKLIQSERRFDKNIKPSFMVDNYYKDKIDKDILFLAYKDDIPVGFIYGYIKYKKGELAYKNVIYIDALYVLDEYRNMGIAKKLINKFYDYCYENNIDIVEIAVFKNNVEALNLYKKLGYEITEYKMKKEL